MLYFKSLFELAADVQPQVDTPAGDEGEQNLDSTAATDSSQVPETTDPVTPSEYDVDGEKVTLEQIREWKKGNMRQGDYTRKTQEIAKQREAYKDAVELYEFLQKNPEYAQKLAELDPNKSVKAPVDPRIQEIDIKLNTMEIERQLSEIKSKDSDANEVEILQIANDNNLSVDKAYKIWLGDNHEKLLQKKLAEQSAKLTQNIAKGKQETKTLIGEGDKPNTKTYDLSAAEMQMADKLGMTYEEYNKWKS
jgi:hypothetical protein